jgi:putative phosphoribosyl transferase
MLFKNRKDAGKQLAKKIDEKGLTAEVIVTLPRGGIPVAIEIAKTLNLPLRLCLVRKLGHPLNNEFAIGAVTAKNILIKDKEFEKTENLHLEKLIRTERKRIDEMAVKFNHLFTPKDIKNKNIILVDDGIATGTCVELAIQELNKFGARKITIATPICPQNNYEKIKILVDDLITCIIPDQFLGIGAFYLDFEQVSDEEVIQLLSQNKPKLDLF